MSAPRAPHPASQAASGAALPTSEAPAPEPAMSASGPEGSETPGTAVDDADAPLVARAQAGDVGAFETLVVRHQDRIYTEVRFLVRDPELASDLTQECFLHAFQGIARFRGDARFLTWLKRIAVNVTLHHFERTGARKRTASVLSLSHGSGREDDDAQGLEVADGGRAPEDAAIDEERRVAIQRAVEALEPEYRTALSLRELHGYSYLEISQALGLPLGTVKSKIFRARQILQEQLKDLW